MKEIQGCINQMLSRRSIRKFKSDAIPLEQLELMLSCMEAAPSAGNLQPWFFYVVKNQPLKNALCTLSFNQTAVQEAPVVFVVCANPALSATQYGQLGEQLFCLQDTACAVQNLLLAAHSLGYGAVWIGVVKDQEIAQLLKLPPELKPVALISVGLPNEPAGTMERKGWQTLTKFID
jgi:nitroreductase